MFPGWVRVLLAGDQRLDPCNALVVTDWFDQTVESFIEIDLTGLD
jgi:hypothetical protein